MDKNQALYHSKHFCLLPWIHYYFHPNGDFYPCCVSTFDKPFGNLVDNSLESIPNSTDFIEMRKQLLNDYPVATCSKCYEIDSLGGESMRKKLNHKFNQLFDQIEFRPDGLIEQFELMYLDLRFSNFCNFKCRGCDPSFSSSWSNDYEQLYGEKKFSASLLSLENVSPGFFQRFKSHLRTTRFLYFAGGEPLLMKEHYETLTELIRLDHTQVELSYNTNLSTLDYHQNQFLPLWQKFESLSFGISIDDLAARGEYFRKGMDWNRTLQNIKKVDSILHDKVHIWINLTISAFNILHLTEILDFLLKLRDRPTYINFNFLQDPIFYRCQILPTELKEEIELKLQIYKKQLTFDQETNSWLSKSLDDTINFLKLCDHTKYLTTFIETTKKLDQIRNESFVKVYPELADKLSSLGYLDIEDWDAKDE